MKLFGKILDWTYYIWVCAWVGMTAGLFVAVFVSWFAGIFNM